VVIYLPDSSALSRVGGSPEVARRLRKIGPTGLATCTPVLLELGFSARAAAEHEKAVLVIAAVAEHHDATVLHYDSGFDLIAEITGHPMEWVVERGSVS
jgi:predicted nucleic acid-binding protein